MEIINSYKGGERAEKESKGCHHILHFTFHVNFELHIFRFREESEKKEKAGPVFASTYQPNGHIPGSPRLVTAIWLPKRAGTAPWLSPRPRACHGRLDLPTESGEEAPAAPRSSAPPLPLARSPAARRPPGANFRGLRSTRDRDDPEQVFLPRRFRGGGDPRGLGD